VAVNVSGGVTSVSGPGDVRRGLCEPVTQNHWAVVLRLLALPPTTGRAVEAPLEVEVRSPKPRSLPAPASRTPVHAG